MESIEEWRKRINLDKFIFLGHSFGGFIATCYGMQYPERIKHLILEDPWAFCKKPSTYSPPFWLRIMNYVYMKFLPLTFIRAAGPFGKNILIYTCTI